MNRKYHSVGKVLKSTEQKTKQTNKKDKTMTIIIADMIKLQIRRMCRQALECFKVMKNVSTLLKWRGCY